MAVAIHKDTLNTLVDAVNVGMLLGVTNIVLDNHSVRGRDGDSGTMFVMPFEDGTEYEFGAIGITRVPELSKRVTLMNLKGSDYTAETELKKRGDDVTFASIVTLKHKKTKVEFKCGDPTLIKIPKGLADDKHFQFGLTRDDLKFIKAANSAMGADHLIFTKSSDGDSLTISLSSRKDSDKATHTIESPVKSLTDTDSFSFKYDSKILIKAISSIESILKKDDLDALDVVITRRGVLTVVIKGMSAYILPTP